MFLVTIGRWSVSVTKQTLGHDSSHSDWPDLQFGVEDIKTLLSRTTNGLVMQCTHALNELRTSCGGQAIELPWKCSLRLMHSTMTGGGWSGTWNTSHWTVSGLRCNNSTMSGGACIHDSHWKDNLSTMSGGGRLSMDIGIESPKHRDSLGPHMNYYIHGNEYSQYAHSQWNTWCHMSRKQYIH